jgi:hypothetical protein
MNKTQLKDTGSISKDSFDLVTCFRIVDDFFLVVGSLSCERRGRKSVLSVSEYVSICLIQQVYEIGCLKRLYELLRDKFSVE